MRKWLSRGWLLIVWLIIVFFLIGTLYRFENIHPQYVGWCEEIHLYNDEWYWQQRGSRLTCAEMHHIPTLNLDQPQLGGTGWWYVYIVGTKQEGVFATQADAEKWAGQQKLVVDPRQVR